MRGFYHANKRVIRGVGVLLLIAAGIRWAASPWLPTANDAFYYLRLADQVASGQWVLDFWGREPFIPKPFYPALIALLHVVHSDWIGAGIWVSIGMGTLLVFLVFLLGRSLLGVEAGWLAAGMTAAAPTMIFYSTQILSEAAFMVLWISALWLGWKGVRSGHPKWWLSVGVLTGLGYLTRETGVIFPLIPLFAVGHALWTKEKRRLQILGLGIVAVLFVGIALPYQMVSQKQWHAAQEKVRLQQTAGEIPSLPVQGVPSPKVESAPPPGLAHGIWSDWLKGRITGMGQRLVLLHFKDGGDREIGNSRLNAAGSGYAFGRVDPGAERLTGEFGKDLPLILGILWENIRGFLGALWAGQPWVIWLFFGIAFVGLFLLEEWKGNGPPLIYLLFSLAGIVLFYGLAGMYTAALGSERYMVPAKPIIWVISGFGMVQAVRWVLSRWGGAFWKTALAWGGAGVIALSAVIYHKPQEPVGWFFGNRPPVLIEEKVGDWLRKNDPEYRSRRIFCRYPALPYYGQAAWVLIPREDLDRIVFFGERLGVDYLYFDLRTSGLRPQLRFLLDAGWKGDPRLEPVVRVAMKNRTDRYGAVLYRFKKELH